MRAEEQRLAYGLAAAAVVIFAVIWTPWNGGGHLAGFVLSSCFAGALALAGRRGHRVWTAFVAFLVGVFGPWGFAYIFGVGYVAFAVWLGWRAHRSIKASLNASPDVVSGRATPLPPAPRRQSGRVTPKSTIPPRRQGRS